MKESWIEPVRYKHVEKLVLKKCKHADDLCVLFSSDRGGEKCYRVDYKDNGVKNQFYLHEFGETGTSLNPFDNVEYFKIARKLNEGRMIDGKTFDQAFVEFYYDAIFSYRDYLLDVARDEKKLEDYRQKVVEAEDEYRRNFDLIESFIKKFKIELADESEPNQ